MGEPIVIHALVAKRAELAGQVLDLDKQKAALKAQLQTIDAALAIFGYVGSPDDIKPRRTQERLFAGRAGHLWRPTGLDLSAQPLVVSS